MISPRPVFAPDIATYTTRAPYITAVEYANAATGVDTSNLVPGGTASQQAAALARIIARASSWADNLCYQVLAATLDTQAGMYRPDAAGTLQVPVAFTPLIAVASVAVGSAGYNAVPLTDLSRVWLSKKVVHIDGTCQPWTTPRRDGRRFVQVGYVNGWANTTLAAGAAAAATSVTVASGLGIYPGMTLTLADGGTTEQIAVASSFVATTTTGPVSVPLAVPLAAGHATGTGVTALPESIKEAVILLASALIKTQRGAEAVVMPGLGSEPDKTEHTESHGLEDVDIAIDLLEPFRRTR